MTTRHSIEIKFYRSFSFYSSDLQLFFVVIFFQSIAECFPVYGHSIETSHQTMISYTDLNLNILREICRKQLRNDRERHKNIIFELL